MIEVDDAELKAAILAYKIADRDLRKRIRDVTAYYAGTRWVEGLTARAVTRPDRRVLLAGARFKPGNPPQLLAATSRRKLPGGAVPAVDWPGFEFGANRSTTASYTSTSRKGRKYRVHNRHTRRQLPPRNARGWVVFPTVKALAPGLVTVWLKATVAAYREAGSGRR